MMQHTDAPEGQRTDDSSAMAEPRRLVLPQNLEAEESVIGCALFSGKLFKKLLPLLSAADFVHPAHAAIFEAMEQLHALGKPIDMISTAEQMRASETLCKLRAHGSEAYLAELSSKVATVENVEHHARIIKEKSIARRLILETSAIRDRALQPGEDVAELARRAHQHLAALARAAAPPAAALFDPKSFLEDATAALSRPIPKKLPFGIAALDDALNGGFPAGGVVGLAAPPKHMKTALLIDLMMRWAAQGERIVYLTGENTAQEIYARCSAREQFGKTNKFHSTIKHEQEPHQIEENRKAIEWLAGKVRIVSLPDEEVREPRGPTWVEVLRQCEQETPAPMVIVDYVEEFADRLPRRDDTDQQANKTVMRILKNYACRRQARVLAVCSVGRGSYSGAEAVFTRADARPEEFRAVAKHSGYIEFAASAMLAMQFADGGDATTDPDSGHSCVRMRLHLAFTREGQGPVTVGVLAFGGFCKFIEDAGAVPLDDVPQLPGLQGQIMRELSKAEHEQGATGDVVARLVGRRVSAVKATLKVMAQEGTLATFARGRCVLFRHPRFGPTPGQTDLPDGDRGTQGGGWQN